MGMAKDLIRKRIVYGADTFPSAERRTDVTRRFPEVTPDYTTHQSSFVLQTIMELQKNVGVLTAAVEHLRTDVKGQGDKIDKLRLWVASVIGGSIVIAFILWLLPATVREHFWTKLVG